MTENSMRRRDIFYLFILCYPGTRFFTRVAASYPGNALPKLCGVVHCTKFDAWRCIYENKSIAELCSTIIISLSNLKRSTGPPSNTFSLSSRLGANSIYCWFFGERGPWWRLSTQKRTLNPLLLFLFKKIDNANVISNNTPLANPVKRKVILAYSNDAFIPLVNWSAN